MAKLTKDEFNTKYADKIKDNDDLLLELMEDFTDSTVVDTTEIDSIKQELDDAKSKYNDLQTKYKERFLSASENKQDNNEEKGLSEKNIINIRTI